MAESQTAKLASKFFIFSFEFIITTIAPGFVCGRLLLLSGPWLGKNGVVISVVELSDFAVDLNDELLVLFFQLVHCLLDDVDIRQASEVLLIVKHLLTLWFAEQVSFFQLHP